MEPVPSLFSVTVEDEGLCALSGTVVENASVRFTGTKMKAQGALLITHLGLSGPAMLKLSAYAARLLHERDYRAEISINWLGDMNEEEAGMLINELARQNGAKQVGNVWPTVLNRRLWHFLLQSLHLSAEMRWNDFVKPNEQSQTCLSFAMARNCTFKNDFVKPKEQSSSLLEYSAMAELSCKRAWFCSHWHNLSWQKNAFPCPIVHFCQAISDKNLLELHVWHASCLT